MRKLLLFFALLSVSIGTWATPTVSTSTWMQNNSAYETQTVASIWIENPGELAAALSQVGVDFQYLHLSAFNSSNPLELSAEDIAALNALDVKTIEMNHVYAPYFEFDNPYVEYITLPYNWTKEQVKAVGETHKTHPNFKACISTSNTENSGDATLIAYLNEAGKMRDAILHSYFDTRDYKTLGSGNGDCSRVRTLVAMGNICAKDISRAGNYDANGHYVINGVADENSYTYNKNTEGGDLYSGGSTDGAIQGCYDINVIDLSEAIIPDAYCADIVPGYAFVTTNLREFWIPEDSNFKTIPADFMNCSAAIHQICIPGNIETIRTRAFAGTNINYIWTTGPDANVRYDNGATFVTGTGNDAVRTQRYKTQVGENYTPTASFNPVDEYPIFQAGDDNSFTYGTFTLPAGLKLIERFAFFSSTSVSDVYILNPVAPECHVDAFNSSQYHANNTVQASSIKEETDEDGNTIKIITREAYNNGIDKPMAMLHYPEDTTDPDIQRYTDPTREYSIATGDRDGKGNMLYFPTQTEFEVAEWQGTYGYVWNAWNIERTWYNQEITLGTGQGWYGGGFISTGGHDQVGGQAKANQFYIDNPNPNPNTGVDKTDRSFYDVTLGDNNQPGEVANPAGLQPYYNTVWKGYQLYPQMETEGATDGQGHPVMETVPVYDQNGKIIYDEAAAGATYEGNYTRREVDVYNKADNGEYCHQLTRDDNGQYIISYSYTENANGEWCKAPWDSNVWTKWESWMGNIQRYDQVATGLTRFTDQHGQPRFNLSDDYVLYDTYNSEYKTLLERFNKEVDYEYTAATSSDAGPFYTMRTQEVQVQNITKQNDYRGWHQFVLAGYGYNGVVPNEPIRSFISDNDWWTICEPYDLKYSELIDFFGTNNGIGEVKKPYLSKLMYVIRDVEKGKITLMFSKNLMEYKEAIASDDQVHGTIDDETTWIGNGEGQYADEAALRAANPVILHKGVPYLIKPNLLEDGNGNIIGSRQFNIYKSNEPELYARLNAAATQGAGAQASMIYDGVYTVPAYVVGLGKDGAGTEAVESSGTKTITNKDGSQFTYKDSENGGKLVYGGKEVDYKISADYTYSFVGSLYNSLMPQYCYFLGYDSAKKKAVFRYSAVQDKSGWNWNNETGIICPNFNTNTKIHSATSFNDPARWTIAGANGTTLQSDDITMPTTGSAKSYTFDFGATNYFEMEEATGVSEMVVKPLYEETKVYDANGIYRGSSLQNLPKGVYVVNGKKYVVK